MLAREGMALSAAWDQRVEREAKETERQRAQVQKRSAAACRLGRTGGGQKKDAVWALLGSKATS